MSFLSALFPNAFFGGGHGGAVGWGDTEHKMACSYVTNSLENNRLSSKRSALLMALYACLPVESMIASACMGLVSVDGAHTVEHCGLRASVHGADNVPWHLHDRKRGPVHSSNRRCEADQPDALRLVRSTPPCSISTCCLDMC